jgi:hypothetical protein
MGKEPLMKKKMFLLRLRLLMDRYEKGTSRKMKKCLFMSRHAEKTRLQLVGDLLASA